MSSCARVDAKPIDREKQIKYDIAKNEDGPLTRAAAKSSPLKDSSVCPEASVGIAVSENLSSDFCVEAPVLEERCRKKRRLDEESVKSTDASIPLKGKRKAGERPTSALVHSPSDQASDEPHQAKCMVDVDERLLNIEEHLAVRYGGSFLAIFLQEREVLTIISVPSVPKTLLARLKNLEDHIIRLEKEYPPWAALHFNQPNRGVCFYC